jgi:hypothetical protein
MRSNAAATGLGLAHVGRHGDRARAGRLDRRDARGEVRLAARRDRDRRRRAGPNSTAIALPSPVPPPVTSTTWPS